MIRTVHTLSTLKIPAPRRPRVKLPRRLIRGTARRLALASGLLLLAYLAACVFMVWHEPQLVYLPARPDEEWLDKPSAAIQDVTLHSPDGSLHAWFLPAQKPDAAMLMCHGQSGNLSARGQGLPEYSRRFNTSMLVFDYPGYGISDGEPTERGCYAAAEAAYEWLLAKGFKPEQIIIYGESLGGGVAIELATRRPHSALLLVNTFANLPEVAQRVYPWAPVIPLMRNRFDSESRIALCRSPIFITHGMADHLIPFSHSSRLFAKITAAKEFLAREGKDHTDPLGPDALERMHSFLVRQGCLPRH